MPLTDEQRAKMKQRFEVADRVSDLIVKILNEEINTSANPVMCMMGLMLALKSIQRTMPPLAMAPLSLVAVYAVVDACLDDLVRSFSPETRAH